MSETSNISSQPAGSAAKSVAVVIPAYKPDFLERALSSLESQTVRDFHVYIGIDASPYDLEAVIAPFAERLPLTCRRFDENLGGHDLVAQWDRCLALTQDEPWLMLFSDDDELEPRCMELFLRTMEHDRRTEGQPYALYHFNVDVIGEKSELLRHAAPYPEVYDAVRFLKDKNAARIEGYVVEYIFSREAFRRSGGFERFDLAWGSDSATWAKLSRERGMRTVPEARVRWRQSSVNITPQTTSAKLRRKLLADAAYLNWCRTNFSAISSADTHYYMFRLVFHYAPHLSASDLKACVKPFYAQTFGGRLCYVFLRLSLPLFRTLNVLRHRKR